MDTPDPTHSSLLHDDGARLPAAAYLRYDVRADGWGPGRQAAFLSHLADHGVVADAARSVGMSLGGGYALRRTARGYTFSLGWEAALLIARRIVADNLMAAAIRGEESRWVREDGVTTYTRQNTKLSLTLLDRVNPAMSLPEVMAVATRFDWFLQLIDQGASAAELWDLFFDNALPHSDGDARERVRGALLLCEESADFDGDEGGEEPPVEFKSMDAAGLSKEISPHAKTRRPRFNRFDSWPPTPPSFPHRREPKTTIGQSKDTLFSSISVSSREGILVRPALGSIPVMSRLMTR